MGSDPQNGKASLPQLNDRQQAFIAYYLRNPNATNAARLAGYQGNEVTLAAVGYENLNKPQIKAEIDRLRKERRLTPDAVLDILESQATADVTPFLNEEGILDLGKLANAGLGHLVKGTKQGREGLEITLVDPQTAQKLLARHHRLVGAQVEIDQSTTVQLDRAALGGLVDQLAAAAQQQQDSTTEQDNT